MTIGQPQELNAVVTHGTGVSVPTSQPSLLQGGSKGVILPEILAQRTDAWLEYPLVSLVLDRTWGNMAPYDSPLEGPL